MNCSNLGKGELHFPEFPPTKGSRSELAKRGMYLRLQRRNYISSCCSPKPLFASWLEVVTDADTAGFQLILTLFWSVFSSFPPILVLLTKKRPRPITRPLTGDAEVAFEKYLITD